MSELKLATDYSNLIRTQNVNGTVLKTMKNKEDWQELGVKVFGDIRILVESTKKLFD
jgi:hypothetical protein